MKQKIKVDGLHAIMAANQKGGASKTTTIAEVAASLKMLGVPILIVNLEVTKTNAETANQSLRTLLRGTKIIDLDCANHTTVSSELGDILDVAEQHGAVILLDVPGAMMTSGNKMWETLMASDYLGDLDSFTLIGTVYNEPSHFSTAVHITNAVDHANKHIFYRGWDDPLQDTRLEDFAEWQKIISTYPSILMGTRHGLMGDVLLGRNKHKDVPGLCLLHDWYDKEGGTKPRKIRQPVRQVLESIDEMSEFLKKHYLPIINDELAAKTQKTKTKAKATS